MESIRVGELTRGMHFAALMDAGATVLVGCLCPCTDPRDRGLLVPEGSWLRWDPDNNTNWTARAFTPLVSTAPSVTLRAWEMRGPVVRSTDTLSVSWIDGGSANRHRQVWSHLKTALASELWDHLDRITLRQPFGGIGERMFIGEVGLEIAGMVFDRQRLGYQLKAGSRLPNCPDDIVALSRPWCGDRDVFTAYSTVGPVRDFHTLLG